MNFDRVGWGEKLILLGGAAYGIQKLLGTPYTIAVTIGLVTFQYLVIQRRFSYWKKQGVPGPKTTFWFGNILEFQKKGGLHAADMEWSKEYGKIFGTYFFGQPDLCITDLELMKQVLVKDFAVFTNRRDVGLDPNETNSLFSQMLTLMKDDRWKNIRNTITPAFTAGKLKIMTPAIEKCEKTLMEILEEKANGEKCFMVKDTMGGFTMDVIAATAFATDINSQRDPDNLFVKYSKEIQNFSFTNWRTIIALLFPWTVGKMDKYLNYRLMFSEGEEFFRNSLSAIIRERRKLGKAGERPDFLQLLMNAAEADTKAAEVEESRDKEISHDVGGKHIKMTEDEIIGQCFLFLIAGYDTVATTITFAAYSLATNPEVQETCRKEILAAAGADGPIEWDAIQHKMPYLEAMIAETLRLYPPASRFDRSASQDYKIGDSITIPKGAAVSIPAYVIHHSDEYYPNPEEFQPERFLPEEKAKRNPLLWLPFGYGPRNCIGMRFAQYEMKLCLANILRNFRLFPCDKTEQPLKLKSTQLLAPVNPIVLGIEKISKIEE